MKFLEDLVLILLIAQEWRLRDRRGVNAFAVVASCVYPVQSFCINNTSGCNVLLKILALHKSTCYKKTSKRE